MSRITKIELLESGYTLPHHKYSIYEKNNKFYLEYNLIGSFATKKNNIVEISYVEYERIVNHLLKYYQILKWKDNYAPQDSFVLDGKEWYLEIYEGDVTIKTIVGLNAYPKNYNSFRNYIENKCRTLEAR